MQTKKILKSCGLNLLLTWKLRTIQ